MGRGEDGEATWTRQQRESTDDIVRAEDASVVENELRRVTRELKARQKVGRFLLGQIMLALTLEEMVAEVTRIPAAVVRAMEPSAVAELRRQRLDELSEWLRSAITRKDLDTTFARVRERLAQ
jgi:hypothetical protein